jgi:preprotein translocase subunit SecD
MRVAVESGWIRARQTRVAANVVQLLSALILYLFATGVVKGFGFALGLTTLLDLAVLFWFTKPMVSWLARFKFFNGGGKWSGLSVETLGTASPARLAKVGGKA